MRVGVSHKFHEGRGSKGTHKEFVSTGAGRSATMMHRVVVLFVLLMVAGVIAHGVVLIEGLVNG